MSTKSVSHKSASKSVAVTPAAEPTAPAVTPVSQTTAANPATAAAASPAFQSKVAQAVSLLDQAIALFEGGENLTASDRIRTQKARKGSGKVIPVIAQAARQMGVSLPLAPIEPMEESAAEAQALAPVQTKIGLLDKLISDQVFVAEGSSWATASKLYVVLSRLAKGNGQLQQLLDPAKEFFAYRHPKVKAEHPKTAKGKAALAAKKAAEAAGTPPPEAAAPADAPAPAPTAPVATTAPTHS